MAKKRSARGKKKAGKRKGGRGRRSTKAARKTRKTARKTSRKAKTGGRKKTRAAKRAPVRRAATAAPARPEPQGVGTTSPTEFGSLPPDEPYIP
jgi:hypothetical protein